MAYNYQETLKEVDKERYNEMLKVAQLSQCPYKLAEGAWSTDMTAWPDVEFPDMYDYLINSPG